jgi:hypothetical protein
MIKRRQYLIKCGDLDGTFPGRGYRDAFRRAVRKQKPNALAALYRFKVCDESGRPVGVWFYADTKCHLEGDNHPPAAEDINYTALLSNPSAEKKEGT